MVNCCCHGQGFHITSQYNAVRGRTTDCNNSLAVVVVVVVVVVIVVVVVVVTLTHNTMQSVVAGQPPIALERKKYLGRKKTRTK